MKKPLIIIESGKYDTKTNYIDPCMGYNTKIVYMGKEQKLIDFVTFEATSDDIGRWSFGLAHNKHVGFNRLKLLFYRLKRWVNNL